MCGGRFVGGPDARNSLGTLTLIVAPSTVWLLWVGHFFTTSFSILFVLLAMALQGGSLAFLVAAALSDPGVLPKQDGTRWDDRTKVLRTKKPAKMYDVLVRGFRYKLKYCETCHIYRPPRCVHCSVCEHCIERFDHHCVWVGNCIGKRNYWMFYSFLTVTSLLNSYTLATSLVFLLIRHQEFKDFEDLDESAALAKVVLTCPVPVGLVCYCICSTWFIVGLWIYHNYLICLNQTTYEQLKEAYPNTNKNPFNRGIIGNYNELLFSRVRPRYAEGGGGATSWPDAALTPPSSMESLEGGSAPTTARSTAPTTARSEPMAMQKKLLG